VITREEQGQARNLTHSRHRKGGLKSSQAGGERGLGSERTCGGLNKLQDRGYKPLEVESNLVELRRFGL